MYKDAFGIIHKELKDYIKDYIKEMKHKEKVYQDYLDGKWHQRCELGINWFKKRLYKDEEGNSNNN